MPSELTGRVRAELVRTEAAATRANVAEALSEIGVLVGAAGQELLITQILSELVGAGPLQGLLTEPDVTDVLVNGPSEVWLERDGRLERTDVTFSSEAQIRALAQRLASQAGRRLDDAVPFVDAALPGGIRLHAVLGGIGRPGTLLSLRVLTRVSLDLADLAARGAFAQACVPLLRRLLQTPVSFLVTGGTGTGKTTLLRALMSAAPESQRILVLEEHEELQIDHPHVVSLQSRPANAEGAGAISVSQLVRQSLRMRPDRIVVGEARGAELVDLLAAMNTGHEGCAATVHANSPLDVPARLEALALPAGLGRDALHSQVRAGVGAILHLRRDSNGLRNVTGLWAVGGGIAGRLEIEQVWGFLGRQPQLLTPDHPLGAALAGPG